MYSNACVRCKAAVIFDYDWGEMVCSGCGYVEPERVNEGQLNPWRKNKSNTLGGKIGPDRK